MTDKAMYGVWVSAQHYNEGFDPSLAGEATWSEVIDSVVAEGAATADQPRLFVATRQTIDGGETVWLPDSFLNARTHKRNPISEGQAKKYLSRRDKAIAAMPPAPETAPAAAEEPQGALVLRLPPPIVDLLATTFKLISEGREVTIRAEELPKQ